MTSNSPINPPTAGKDETAELKALLGDTHKSAGRSRWLWRALAAGLLLGGGYAYWSYSMRATTYSYTTTAAKQGDLTVLVTATGSVEPTVKVDVSSEQSGTVRDVLVDYNSPVKLGEVVARLDTAKLEANVKSAEASLMSAKASVAKADADMNSAKVSYDRLKSLVSSRVSSQQEMEAAGYTYEAAVATKESAQANVLSAEADLEQARLSLSKATIISPIDGIVLSRDVDPGATVAASLEAPTLFTIAGDLKQMELQVDIDEADVGQVEVGQAATFTVDAFADKRFPAEITSVRYASETVNDVVTYMGILKVENNQMLLRPGMTATADIVVQSITGALLIPNAALRYTPPESLTAKSSGGSGMFSLFRPPRMGSVSAPEPEGNERTVWLMKNDVPTAVNIEIGASDGQSTVVTKGDIAVGDLLITDATEKNG
ncbi:hemolysin secretion protein D [Ciceribacter naphthalenivorans]|uniref:Hemolysin secretion protein D n=3 Tax=Alphaproteobacteria TaxID=28211 RepID=A0A512HCX1_9HYPH|nr:MULTISPECIES: efflux RND transporter periplasmic adaptor subunit [Alphaproteobacteria]GEO83299.1 hemolysin secretion protein D [Ciceribacter naphthalenivorans]GLR20306.1 hemolysin secretion protein D [Ciceribacter naphthalenivorans]GLT03162.1 hemolysin secretion protein D [Sphingomonas psychrolutea]